MSEHICVGRVLVVMVEHVVYDVETPTDFFLRVAVRACFTPGKPPSLKGEGTY